VTGASSCRSGNSDIDPGTPARTLAAGLNQHMAVIELDSVESAIAASYRPAYEVAHKLLGDKVERDIRIVEASS
jgi:hypothetical protein